MPLDLLELAQAWRDPDAWTGMTAAGGVKLPGEVAGVIAVDELVITGGTWRGPPATPSTMTALGLLLSLPTALVYTTGVTGPEARGLDLAGSGDALGRPPRQALQGGRGRLRIALPGGVAGRQVGELQAETTDRLRGEVPDGSAGAACTAVLVVSPATAPDRSNAHNCAEN